MQAWTMYVPAGHFPMSHGGVGAVISTPPGEDKTRNQKDAGPFKKGEGF